MHRRDDDFTSEIEAHIAIETERLVAEGSTPDEARAAALRRFGNVTASRERFHESRRVIWLEDVGKDVRYALRALARSPGFAAVAVLTIALGIGANTAIFGILYQTLLKPLPFAAPDRLVVVSTLVPQIALKYPVLPVAAPDFLEFRRSNAVFSEMAALRAASVNLTGAGDPERIRGARVSANFFAMLGIAPERGRNFTPDEDIEGRDNRVLISHALWTRRFRADPEILNRTISLNGQPHVVIGVMPADLMFPTGKQLDDLVPFGPRVDLWKPMAFTRNELRSEGDYSFGVIGRLKDGVTLEAARQNMDVVARANKERILKQAPGVDIDLKTRIAPLQEVFSDDVRQGLLILEAASGLLLMIVCVNLANLFLVRMSSRGREFATRAALGAARWRLVRQMLTESLVVTAIGGAVGVPLAAWGGRALMLYAPQDAVMRPWTLDAPVLAFAIVVALITGFAFGVVPALEACRQDVNTHVKNASCAVSGGRAGRLRRALVTLEVALCTGLLAVAGLLLHSFTIVMRVDAGFAVERTLAVDLSLPTAQYGPPQTLDFYRQLVERVSALPGVAAAGAVSLLPLAHEGVMTQVLRETDTEDRLDRPIALRRYVSPGLFAAMEIPLLAGRVFAEQEPVPSIVMSDGLAKRLWPGQPHAAIVGRHVRQGEVKSPLLTVVGIVGDIRADSLDRDAPPAFYRPHLQLAMRDMTLVVRTADDPLASAPAIRAEIARLDGNLPVAAMRTMSQIVSTSVADRRFQMALMTLFAVLALVLAIVGIYGVTSYAVARRTQEIGLRVALGAERADVMRSVLVDGLKPVVVGVVAGIGAGQIGAMFIRSALFGIGPLDPIALVGVTTVLVATATLACYLPARGAAALDPVTALRSE